MAPVKPHVINFIVAALLLLTSLVVRLYWHNDKLAIILVGCCIIETAIGFKVKRKDASE